MSSDGAEAARNLSFCVVGTACQGMSLLERGEMKGEMGRDDRERGSPGMVGCVTSSGLRKIQNRIIGVRMESIYSHSWCRGNLLGRDGEREGDGLAKWREMGLERARARAIAG